MIYLYVKTHKKTGLKYLGKTSNKDPIRYKGSGTYWRRHLKKHGNDIETEILFQSENKEEIREKGLYYSELWKVTESKDWANIIEESGDGGDTSQTEAWKEGMKNRIHKIPEIHSKSALGKVWYTDGITNILIDEIENHIPDGFIKGRVMGPNKIKKNKRPEKWNHSEEDKKKMAESAKKRIEKIGIPKSAWKKGHIPKNKGIPMSEEQKQILKTAVLKQKKYTCEHCGKTMFAGNYTRWHGEKCNDKLDT
jgi:hypothetical protein